MPARCQNPRITLYAYESRDPGKVFVRIPNEQGRWVLTDVCVVEVPCPICEALVGEPCKNQHYPKYGKTTRYWAGTHADRKSHGVTYRRKNPRCTPGEPKDQDIKPVKPRYRVKAAFTRSEP